MVRVVSIAARDMSARLDEDLAFLRENVRPRWEEGLRCISVVDLFSGCGGLSLGILEGARRCSRGAYLALAVDNDPSALAVLSATFGGALGRTALADLSRELASPGRPVARRERKLFDVAEGASVLVAGPPCQGHSALNNHTRHNDPRNDLYLSVARGAEILAPQAVVVENVRGVGRDRRGAMNACCKHLERLGYVVVGFAVDVCQIGVPQHRERHLLVATLDAPFVWDAQVLEQRTVGWAIADLLDQEPDAQWDLPTAVSPASEARIDYLFEHDVYDLPNELRPRCHHSVHSYISMYGRLRWDAPAQTITSGFGTMGQGRFVHPLRRRTLTAHEAARLQFLPDFMAFSTEPRRTALARMIGNAVPPRLGMAVATQLIAQGLVSS